MEWVHELLATAVLAVLLSFVVAKLVSVAMAGDDVRDPDGEPGERADRAPAPGGAELGARLSSRGPESERGVESVRGAAAGKVDRFGDEVASAVEEEAVEEARCGEEEVGTGRDEAAGGPPVAVELPAEPKAEEESVGASELVVEKESECRSGGAEEDDDRPSLGGKYEKPQPHVPKSAEVAREEQSEHEQERIDEKKEVLRVGGDDDGGDGGGDGDGDGDDDDDDGWEGIERSELEKKFASAARYVDPANTDDRLESIGSDVRMQLYGLHKVATEGPCHETQPMALMVSARAKCDGGKCLRCARNAWQRLGNMSPDVAMEQYISLLAENIPDWEVAKTADENKSDVAMPKAQDCNLSTGSCDQLEYTNLRKPSMESLTDQTDMSKDENQ